MARMWSSCRTNSGIRRRRSRSAPTRGCSITLSTPTRCASDWTQPPVRYTKAPDRLSMPVYIDSNVMRTWGPNAQLEPAILRVAALKRGTALYAPELVFDEVESAIQRRELERHGDA